MSIHILSDNLETGSIRIRINNQELPFGGKTSYEISKDGVWSSFYYYDYGITLERPPFNDIKDLIRSDVQHRMEIVKQTLSEINTLEKLFDRIDNQD